MSDDKATKKAEKAKYDIAYAKSNIKRVPLDMQKTDYEQLRAAAEARGEKVNEYIKNAIRERMERDRLTADEAGGGSGIWEAPSDEDIKKLLDLPHTDVHK